MTDYDSPSPDACKHIAFFIGFGDSEHRTTFSSIFLKSGSLFRGPKKPGKAQERAEKEVSALGLQDAPGTPPFGSPFPGHFWASLGLGRGL